MIKITSSCLRVHIQLLLDDIGPRGLVKQVKQYINYRTKRMTESLERTFSKDLLKPSFDLSIDFAELTVDSLLENEMLKEIPLVKSIVGAVKTGLLIKEKFFAKKVLTFLKKFNDREIDVKDLNEFKEKFDTDSDYRSKVIEELLVRIDRINDISKSIILANLFSAFIERKIDWDDFCHLTLCLEVIHPNAYAALDSLAKKKWIGSTGRKDDEESENNALLMAAGIGFTFNENQFTISKLGRKLYEFGIKDTMPNHKI